MMVVNTNDHLLDKSLMQIKSDEKKKAGMNQGKLNPTLSFNAVCEPTNRALIYSVGVLGVVYPISNDMVKHMMRTHK